MHRDPAFHRSLPAEVHDEQDAGAVDRRAFDAAGVFAGRRDLPAFEQRLRGGGQSAGRGDNHGGHDAQR